MDLFVAKETAFQQRDRKIIAYQDLEIGVFRLDGDFYAYRNQCAHRGGPVCQGKILEKVEEVIAQDKTSQGLKFSQEQIHIICPWHGYEYDIKSGLHPGNKRVGLKKYDVKLRDGGVYVVL